MIDNQLFTNSFSSLFMVVRVALNTTRECTFAYICHAFRDYHRGQAAAFLESTNVNGSNAVSYIIISNSARDIDISRILVRI